LQKSSAANLILGKHNVRGKILSLEVDGEWVMRIETGRQPGERFT